MKALSAEDVADLRRWLISGAVIVLAHGAIAAGMVNWRDEIEPGGGEGRRGTLAHHRALRLRSGA
jgi:hypothetical protein